MENSSPPPGGPPAFCLEDLQVGQRFASGSHFLEEAELKRFAAEFDPQPFHLDDEAAQATLFGGLAAAFACAAKPATSAAKSFRF